jgi:hypothetical protein
MTTSSKPSLRLACGAILTLLPNWLLLAMLMKYASVEKEKSPRTISKRYGDAWKN